MSMLVLAGRILLISTIFLACAPISEHNLDIERREQHAKSAKDRTAEYIRGPNGEECLLYSGGAGNAFWASVTCETINWPEETDK